MSDSAGQSNSGKPYEVYFFGTCSLNGEILECWQVRESGDEICSVFARLDHPLVSHQQDRRNTVYKVAACLNACDGINPEAVPELVEACERFIDELGDKFAHLDGQCTCSAVGSDPDCPRHGAVDFMRAALSKAKAHD